VQELPQDFENLQSLVDFNASGCLYMSRLPESFGQLANLKRLVLYRCGKLQSLPTSIGGLTKLEVLDISQSRVQELPENFGKLDSLK
jgi:Leucine-rich repeat (LRR) protein